MGRGARRDNADHIPAGRREPRRKRLRPPYRWTDARLEAELREFCKGRAAFPTATEFDAANRADLRSAVNELGGSAYWAEAVGLPLPRERRRNPYDQADALREAQAVIAKLGYLPGEPTLRRLGYQRLATRVRQAGGAARFSELHGLPPKPPT